ncbi:hypothetical protein C8J56DRAFT_307393 [Mycena floridula]|nr:hypothetical protein C8J56DRAFT_307393 [Mycena floridula]
MGHRKSKKPRLELVLQEPELPRFPAESSFENLPFEIISEILLSTGSPKDVLSIARCSKFFCATLLHPNSKYIWKHARQNCKPEPLPEPIAQFTESAYAAFVMDDGNCEMCSRPTTSMYTSFALRLRLCKQSDCINRFSCTRIATPDTKLESLRLVSDSLPTSESSACIYPHSNPAVTYPAGRRVHRSTQWNAAFQEYMDASQSPQQLEAYTTIATIKSARNKTYMTFCLSVHEFRLKYDAAKVAISEENSKFSTELASRTGVPFWDLMNTCYGDLHRRKNKLLETVNQTDYDVHKVTIDTELLNMQERRKRRAAEERYRNSRNQVEKHYNRLSSTSGTTSLPPLEAFRKLPIIGMIQKPQSTLDVGKELKSGLVAQLLGENLDLWRANARETLGGLLGYPKWTSPSSTVLHPVDRWDARFQCRRCNRVSNRYAGDECLDFGGVCAHKCSKPRGEKLPRHWKEWKIDHFIKDVQACSAATQLLALCEINPEGPPIWEGIGDRIKCLSCDSSCIIMGPTSVIGHSHRHEDMKLALLHKDEADASLSHPLTPGLGHRLLASGPDVQNLVKYGCRHCSQRPNATSKLQLLNFNGLRSHLASKHKVSKIRDEDFFSIDPILSK